MVEISNLKVYDLRESVIACRNAMRVYSPEYSYVEFNDSLKRAIALAKSPSNSGHPNFLKGIRVSFDLKYPNYFTPELQRYSFIDIVCSSSKMHKLLVMADKSECYNKYVLPETINRMRKLVTEYNVVCDTGDREDQYYAFMRVLSNCPLGIELFMRISTNYMQLRNIYHQRENHKLQEDWGAFCKMIRSLPYFAEFINPSSD